MPEGPNAKNDKDAEFTSAFEAGKEQAHKIPITVRYGNSSDDSFKFIQSVNIINGYNVNLSENKERVYK